MRAVESLAEQPEIGEIIVVDDQSTDRTPAILGELLTRLPKLKVLRTNGLPSGWTGKNHAASVGAAAAAGDWLLFTDADTCHTPGSAAEGIIDSVLYKADFVSYSPEQEVHTFWEHALVPMVYWRLSQRYPFDQVNNVESPDAAANGQYILMRRDAYELIGGHAAVAGEILEEVALAKRAKQAGYKIHFAPLAGVVKTRMYRSFGAMWEGWTKNLYPLVGGNLSEVLLEIDAATPWLGVVLPACPCANWGWESASIGSFRSLALPCWSGPGCRTRVGYSGIVIRPDTSDTTWLGRCSMRRRWSRRGGRTPTGRWRGKEEFMRGAVDCLGMQ